MTLERKELIINIKGLYDITDSGKRVLSDIEEEQTVEKVIPRQNSISITDLHKSLQDRLFEKKNKRQVVGFGGVYFIPALKDLETFLGRFRRQFPDMYNLDKIQKCLLKHIDQCCKKDSFAPAIKYYIIKEGTGSQLAAALEVFEEVQEETQYKVTLTKDLFE